jgi:hypothetical protein
MAEVEEHKPAGGYQKPPEGFQKIIKGIGHETIL